MSNNDNDDEEEDDPFAVFGEDDEEDEDDDDETDEPLMSANRQIAQSLLLASSSKHKPEQQQDDDPESIGDIMPSDMTSSWTEWPPPASWPKPLFVANVTLVSNLTQYGGARGYVARRDLPAGTLVLTEQPIIAWPEANVALDWGMVGLILADAAAAGPQPEQQQKQQSSSTNNETMTSSSSSSSSTANVLHALEHLYPTKEQVDRLFDGKEWKQEENDDASIKIQIQDMMLFYQRQQMEIDNTDLDLQQEESSELGATRTNNNDNNNGVIAELLEYAIQHKLPNSDGTPLQERDLLRCLVALRYNSLETGVYLHVAMLNHDDRPNCVKFRNDTTENDDNNDSSTTTTTRPTLYNQVRLIRNVRAGEPLTISYLPQSPSISAHAKRRYQLWQHHRFDIGPLQQQQHMDTNNNNKTQQQQAIQMELCGGKMPPSSIHNVDSDSVPHRVETATSELLQELAELQNVQQQPTISPSGQLPQEEWHRAQALELASRELFVTAQEQLQNEQHVLLLPVRQLHLHVCDLVLQQHQGQQQADSSNLLTPLQHMALLGRVIGTSLHLWQLQQMLYQSPDYYDLAQTQWELAQAVEQVLSQKASYLTGLRDEISPATMQWFQRNHPKSGAASWSTSVAGWTALEYYSRREHERIKALYPRGEE